MLKRRKNYTPEEKVAILKKHFVEKVTVSDLCDRYNLQPTVFYRWPKVRILPGSPLLLKDLGVFLSSFFVYNILTPHTILHIILRIIIYQAQHEIKL